MLKGAEMHDYQSSWLKSHICKGETNKGGTWFMWLAQQRICKNGQREDEYQVTEK